MLPRCGLGHKQRLVLGNSVGVIDADYEGHRLISAWNRNPKEDCQLVIIRPGERIAQLVFIRIAQPEFTIVVEFSVIGGREQGGFGSTGIDAACLDAFSGQRSPQ